MRYIKYIEKINLHNVAIRSERYYRNSSLKTPAGGTNQICGGIARRD